MKVRRISPECGIGACQAVYEIDEGSDLIIVGLAATEEELRAIATEIRDKDLGEVAVRIPRLLIANLKL